MMALSAEAANALIFKIASKVVDLSTDQFEIIASGVRHYLVSHICAPELIVYARTFTAAAVQAAFRKAKSNIRSAPVQITSTGDEFRRWVNNLR